ncbi:serine-rich adhesin for platelets-like isoform X3 [Ylistrum balloti]|uniref:serine-rich adhesin for platelets-like isoform X3 n=1 Tax=Ylistrum balloti TaxID=509963 RepID=UPI00290593AE|nr:serine-rich adhesin for platelets-like isoform X3 [Ylistrum balloti]
MEMRGSQGQGTGSTSKSRSRNRKSSNEGTSSTSISRSRNRKSSNEEFSEGYGTGDEESTEIPTTLPSSRTTSVGKSSTTPSSTITTVNPATSPTTITTNTARKRTNNSRSGRTTTQMTTSVALTSSPIQPVETSAPTFAPTPANSVSNKVTITVLAAVTGIVFLIVIILALCLAWRKWCQTRPATDVTKRDKSTYHMYSEIDHTTMILDEEPRGPSNQRGTGGNGRALPSAPAYDDVPDTLVNENAYNMLHQKEFVESKNTYSVLDRRFVDLNDPQLNTYDVMSNIKEKAVNVENTSGSLEPGQKQSTATPGSILDNVNCNPNSSVPSGTPHDGQYFVLEKLSNRSESVNDKEDEIDHTDASGSDNYFKLEPHGMTS